MFSRVPKKGLSNKAYIEVGEYLVHAALTVILNHMSILYMEKGKK